MLSANHAQDDDGTQFRIGLTAPMNMTALRAVLDAVQSVWPESQLGTPADGEAAVILIPRESLLNEAPTPLQAEADIPSAHHQVEEHDVAAQTDVTVISPDGAETAPPEEALNLLSGYCHGILESLPEGVEAVRQTIRLPDREEPYVLTLQPLSQTGSVPSAHWGGSEGWVNHEVSPPTPSSGDQMRRKALQRVASLPALSRTLNKSTRAQIIEALKAE